MSVSNHVFHVMCKDIESSCLHVLCLNIKKKTFALMSIFKRLDAYQIVLIASVPVNSDYFTMGPILINDI